MKKILTYTFFAFVLSVSNPILAKADVRHNQTSALTSTITEKTQAELLQVRLDEINTLDKSSLTKSEKKVLRKEVRSIKSELSQLTGGVYLSASSLLIILILLIILF